MVFRSAIHKPWQKYFERPPTDLIREAIRDVEQTTEILVAARQHDQLFVL